MPTEGPGGPRSNRIPPLTIASAVILLIIVVLVLYVASYPLYFAARYPRDAHYKSFLDAKTPEQVWAYQPLEAAMLRWPVVESGITSLASGMGSKRMVQLRMYDCRISAGLPVLLSW